MTLKTMMIAVAAGTALIATPALAQNAAPAPDAAAPTVSGPTVSSPDMSGPTVSSKVDAGQNAAPPAEPAAEAPAGPFTLEVGVAGVSDYRFRGVSLSNKKAAVQPYITLSHSSGFHVGGWASNIAANDGDDIEIDLIAGWGKTLGPIDFDINATYYVYPGLSEINYVEFISTASHAFGSLTLGTTVAYTPRQGAAVTKRGLYGAVNAALAIPKTPFSINGSLGIEDNGYYHNKRDWSVGVAADVAGFTVGANYIKASHAGGDPLARGRFVLSLSKSFENNF